MTTRDMIFGALAWVLVAGTLTATALEPVSAEATGCAKPACVNSSDGMGCATLA